MAHLFANITLNSPSSEDGLELSEDSASNTSTSSSNFGYNDENSSSYEDHLPSEYGK